ncbi:MAG: ABC transporter ATP-binding protein [Betaproteobacteria bacterium HGW-Betaproteobacteria-11]|nr:MAG: ABC transporter ATP-binding protein [Betaproteobacteria bacterium HGW-Betaproteobacteria-11]
MTAAVRIVQATKRFGATLALDRIEFDIAQGEFFGLLGPNGAGKTTLISALAGLVKIDSGRLEVMGCDVRSDYRAARRQLGVVPQELVFDPFFTVRETLRMQAGYFGIGRSAARDSWIDEILEHLDLTPKAEANMRTLSGGMKRRVLVAQALVHRPPVIVLDEPTAGVDVELRQTLWQFIHRLNREGHTIVLTTHYLEEAESMCDRIAMLKAGCMVALDTTRNLLDRSARRTLRLRTFADLSEMPGGGQPQGDGWWIFSFEQFAEIEPLLACIRAAGGEIAELEINQPDLEQVFIRIMREQEQVDG